jgi:hypothetical protein
MDLISLLIIVLVFGALFYIIGLIPMPPPFKTASLIILALIFIVYLLGGIHIGHIGYIR